jgi:uncharacterized paraquat-inducible protein A
MPVKSHHDGHKGPWVPTGEKARAVKARHVGVCRGCGAYTQPRNGKGEANAYCKRCHPGAILDCGRIYATGTTAASTSRCQRFDEFM